MSKLSKTLKDCMLEAGYNETSLANISGIYKSHISEYLSGKHMPTYAHFVQLLYTFHCSAEYLLGIQDIHTDEPLHPVPPFGERLRFILKSRKLSQKRLCEQLNLSSCALYKWLSGKNNPSVESLIRLAEFFDCSVDYLIGRVR